MTAIVASTGIVVSTAAAVFLVYRGRRRRGAVPTFARLTAYPTYFINTISSGFLGLARTIASSAKSLVGRVSTSIKESATVAYNIARRILRRG